MADDWTADERGVSNMSPKYREVVAAVEQLIRDDAHMLIGGRADATARLIVSNLAHRFGMAPTPEKVHQPTTDAQEGT